MPFKKQNIMEWVKETNAYFASLDFTKENSGESEKKKFVHVKPKDAKGKTYLQRRDEYIVKGAELGLNRLERIEDMPYVVLNELQRAESYYLTQTKIMYELIDDYLNIEDNICVDDLFDC